MEDRVELESRSSGKTRSELLRKLRKFDHWLGERKDGEWVRESICCDPVTRKVTHLAKSQTERNERGEPLIVRVEREEIVYQHDGFHPHMEGEKKARKAFFWRGARVWRQ